MSNKTNPRQPKTTQNPTKKPKKNQKPQKTPNTAKNACTLFAKPLQE